MTGTYTDSIREERDKIIARVMREHRIGECRTVRPVEIEVRERTGRVVYPGQYRARGPITEQWIVTYSTGETHKYDRLEPSLDEETP